MRLISILMVGLFLTADILSAQEIDYSIDNILESETPQYVEVCQDFICNKLREEILVEASKCRPLASFKRRRMRVKRSRAANSCKMFKENNFKLSKGKCSAAIRDACSRAGMDAKYLADNAYNLHKKGLLEKAGFVNLIWKYDEHSAPLGSILIYVGGAGHRYGHVEVRANPNLYCSDHCNGRPVTGVNEVLNRKYKLVAVYLPFVSSIQMSAALN
ncbi:MAG TPA: hypothetical protein PKC28_06875 [Bdellovibrionales bacterium]|nr:hypothetical protein [Bdellovibrionales bacterium]